MIRRLLTWLRLRRCRHLFRGVDLRPRDAAGIVSWPCARCGFVWRGEYGLKAPGTITGPWSPEKIRTVCAERDQVHG